MDTLVSAILCVFNLPTCAIPIQYRHVQVKQYDIILRSPSFCRFLGLQYLINSHHPIYHRLHNYQLTHFRPVQSAKRIHRRGLARDLSLTTGMYRRLQAILGNVAGHYLKCQSLLSINCRILLKGLIGL